MHAWKYNIPGSNKYFPMFLETWLQVTVHCWRPRITPGHLSRSSSGKKPEFLQQSSTHPQEYWLVETLEKCQLFNVAFKGRTILETASMKCPSLMLFFFFRKPFFLFSNLAKPNENNMQNSPFFVSVSIVLLEVWKNKVEKGCSAGSTLTTCWAVTCVTDLCGHLQTVAWEWVGPFLRLVSQPWEAADSNNSGFWVTAFGMASNCILSFLFLFKLTMNNHILTKGSIIIIFKVFSKWAEKKH